MPFFIDIPKFPNVNCFSLKTTPELLYFIIYFWVGMDGGGRQSQYKRWLGVMTEDVYNSWRDQCLLLITHSSFESFALKGFSGTKGKSGVFVFQKRRQSSQ